MESSQEVQRDPANLKTQVNSVTIDSLEKFNLEDKYQIRQKISQGGFGSVYKVMRRSDNRLFAAKCISIDSINERSELLKPYVEREISYLMSFDCNYIMKLEEGCFVSTPTTAVKEDHLVIMSELAEGNLEDFIMKYPGDVPEETVINLFTQILLGVNFLHRNKIDHRDLKPLNILMFNNGRNVKLADFGLARNISSEYTKMTVGLGTIDYWAPEVIERDPRPFKSDMYSLGLILHFMMTKTLPTLSRNVRPGIFKIPS